MHTKRFKGIDTVDPVVWDQLTVGYPFAGRDWCRYAEANLRRPSYYFIVYDGETPIAGAIFMVIRSEIIPASNRILRTFLSLYLRWRPLILCRTAPTTNHKALFLPADPQLRASALAEIKQAAHDLGREYHGSFLLFDYLDKPDADLDWGEFFPLTEFADTGTRMEVHWETWDEFMQDLRQRSKKQHKNVRNNTRYALERNITVKFSHEAPPEQEVCQLIKTKMQHYRVPFSAEDILLTMRALECLPPEKYIWATAHHDGKMVACEVLLRDPGTGVCLTTLYGRDYSVKYVYFYLAYRDIQYMIEEFKATAIIYDTEAYEFKERIGFGDDPRNNLAFYPHSRLERSMTNILMRLMDE